jgi:hypothetical protein
MCTEVTLLNRALIFVQVNSVVGTSLHTSSAANASISININDSIWPFFQRIDRTNGDTRRI